MTPVSGSVSVQCPSTCLGGKARCDLPTGHNSPHENNDSGRLTWEPLYVGDLRRQVEDDVAAAEAWRKVVGWVEDFHMRPDGEDRPRAMAELIDLITVEVYEGDA